MSKFIWREALLMEKNMKNIWIDTDMGNDDIMALAMLAQDPKIKIEAISLVNGVSRAKKGVQNLQGILQFLDLNPQLFEDKSVKEYPYKLEFPKQDINRAEELTLLSKLPIQPTSAATLDISQLLQSLPDQSVLLALGPLTNIASLIKQKPELFKQKISEIVLMGGGIEKGNVPPLRVAEYNIALDPLSAQVVFDSGFPITMVGIDATSQVPCTEEFKQQVKSITPPNKPAAIIKEILVNNQTDFDAFYDPLAAAILIDQNLIRSSIKGTVNVVTNGANQGQTLFTADTSNVRIPLLLNPGYFYSLIEKIMKGDLIS